MRQSVMLFPLTVWAILAPLCVDSAEPRLAPAITSDAVCLVQWNGEESWTAYKKTASYRAFFESGLVPGLISELPQFAWRQFLTLTATEIPEGVDVSEVSKLLMPAWTNGGILALGVQTDEKSILPYLVLVVRGGANGYSTLNSLVKLAEIEFNEAELSGHKVSRLENSHQEVAYWTEGDDLVIFYSFEASETHAKSERLLSAAATEHLDDQPAWREAWTEEPIPTDSFRLWLNLKQIIAVGLQVAGAPDESGPLQEFLAFTGIDQLQTFAYGSGCHGNHLVHQWSLQAKQSPLQVIGWGEQTVSLDQLPPLPADVCSFSLQVVDLERAFKRLAEVHSQLMRDPGSLVSFLSELGLPDVHVSIQEPENRDALVEQVRVALSALEPVVCLYNDRKQQLLPCGIPTIAVKVKDPAVLLAQLEKLGWKRDDRWGCPTFYEQTNPSDTPLATIESSVGDADEDADEDPKPKQPVVLADKVANHLKVSFGTTTIAVCDGWIVGGIQPQTVRSFVLRSQGKLPRWTPDKIVADTQAKLPAKFTRLVYDDPRASIETIASLAPWLRDGLQMLVSAVGAADIIETKPASATGANGPAVVKADFQLPVASPLDIPPVELVVAPLFPNVSVTTVMGNITRERTYGSSFAQNPVLWGIAGFFGLTIGLDLL